MSNSLAARAPLVAAEWHPRRNGARTPADVVWSSNAHAFWKCPAAVDHQWRARINNRTSNRAGCPFCSGNAVAPSTSLASVFPDLAREWDIAGNGGMRPQQVTTQSNRVVVWRCRADPSHEWRASVQSRARGSGCPRCSGWRRATS